MTTDPIRDAARELAADAEPPGPEQETTIAGLAPHVTQDSTTADDTAA